MGSAGNAAQVEMENSRPVKRSSIFYMEIALRKVNIYIQVIQEIQFSRKNGQRIKLFMR